MHASEFVHTVRKATSPTKISLGLSDTSGQDFGFMMSGLNQANAPIALDLRLQHQRNGTELNALANAIKSTTQPLTLILRYNILTAAEINKLASATKKAGAAITLDLELGLIHSRNGSELDALANAIKKAKKPLTLDLHENTLTPAEFQTLAEAIPSAKKAISINLALTFLSNPGQIHASIQAISSMISGAKKPLHITLRNNNIVDPSDIATALRYAKAPISLNLRNNNIVDSSDIATALRYAKAPISLNLRNNNIGDTGAKIFAQELSNKTSPITLNLSHNSISDEGATALAEAIKVAPGRLDIALTDIPPSFSHSPNYMQIEGVLAWINTLEKTNGPLTLNMGNMGIGKLTSLILSTALEKSKVPVKLKLSGNPIPTEGARFIAGAIEKMKVSLDIDITDTKIGEEGAADIADALQKAHTAIQIRIECTNKNTIAAIQRHGEIQEKTYTSMSKTWQYYSVIAKHMSNPCENQCDVYQILAFLGTIESGKSYATKDDKGREVILPQLPTEILCMIFSFIPAAEKYQLVTELFRERFGIHKQIELKKESQSAEKIEVLAVSDVSDETQEPDTQEIDGGAGEDDDRPDDNGGAVAQNEMANEQPTPQNSTSYFVETVIEFVELIEINTTTTEPTKEEKEYVEAVEEMYERVELNASTSLDIEELIDGSEYTISKHDLPSVHLTGVELVSA